MTKIVLGSAQFSGNYGVSNLKKKTYLDEIRKIINYSKKQKIKLIDTAPDYFKNNKINKLLYSFDICTKIPSLKKIQNKKINYFINKTVNDEIAKYRKKRLNSVIFHSVSDLKNKKKMNLAINSLDKLKTKGKLKYIGASIYNYNDFVILLKLFDNSKLDIIQIPINLVNRDFINTDFIKIVRKKRIKIQARSIFLQGLLLMKKKDKYFDRWKKNFKSWDDLPITLKIHYCYKFVNELNFINKIVVGFNNVKEIKLFYKSIKINSGSKNKFLLNEIIDQKLTNPTKWKLKKK